MKSICFVCNRYPSILTPTRHVFVQKLVWALADMGVECTVIAPVPVNQYISTYRKQPVSLTEFSPKGSEIKLLFPRYFSFGQRNILGYGTSRLTTDVFHKVVRKAFINEKIKPDAIYGHFLVPAGITAARLGKEFGIPAFAAYGEATPRDLEVFGLPKLREELDSLHGIVSVSSANQDILNERNILEPDKIKVFPNGIQGDRFYPKDKDSARKKFGFDKEPFQVSFVGQFNHRKGVLRLDEALKDLDNVTVAYAGSGKLSPEAGNCVYKNLVKPADMADFLSASDIFVMPTLNEGCSNAIVEAISCGLPVVSSDLPFNKDILGPDNAILIDPMDVKAIRDAVLHLMNNPKEREEKQKATIARAKTLTIEGRAANIKTWIEEKSQVGNNSVVQ